MTPEPKRDDTAARRTEMMEHARRLLAQLTPDERQELFSSYCRFCGGPVDCHCWNDE